MALTFAVAAGAALDGADEVTAGEGEPAAAATGEEAAVVTVVAGTVVGGEMELGLDATVGAEAVFGVELAAGPHAASVIVLSTMPGKTSERGNVIARARARTARTEIPDE